jgi:NAD(P)-dependent dehydrogenase (short-subunit alcohol dehydrogenase family)
VTGLAAFSLTGSRIVVTGAESGLGLAIATACVDAGADVIGADVAVDMNVDAGDGPPTPGSFRRMHVDLCNRESVAGLVERAVDTLGGVDACVNCAGIGGRAPAVAYPDEQWDRVIATNLTGSFAMARAVGVRTCWRRDQGPSSTSHPSAASWGTPAASGTRPARARSCR